MSGFGSKDREANGIGLALRIEEVKVMVYSWSSDLLTFLVED